jgi:ATP-dependent Lon protease
MKKVGVRNPTFMLDEVDKMNVDFRGDPASALLEVLDPAQNKDFSDHYLEVEFDLSEVFFVATANNADNIPYALHDRMEIVELSGYTQMEKVQIAELFLLPRQMEAAGLKLGQLHFSREAIDMIIQRYTREAGVRELERQIAHVCRKSARDFVETGRKKGATREIGPDVVIELLGPPRYSLLRAEVEARVGVAIGMAYTGAGGDILSIETSVMRGKGKLQLTGQLGSVMKESAQAAYTYLRSHAAELGVPEAFHKELDLHVHVPEGATPKDGPSAGVAMFVSMLSALTNRTPAPLVSMTGEITLRGRVLAVGGIKEKVLAAHRAGIRHILLPKENEKDLPEIPKEVRDEVVFTLAEEIGDVLPVIFEEAAAAATR